MKRKLALFAGILLFSLLAIPNSSKSQKIISQAYQQIVAPFNTSSDELPVNCLAALPPVTCNYLRNINFTPTIAYQPFVFPAHIQNPFGLNLVPDWDVSHGNPQITDGVWDFNAIPPGWLALPSSPPPPATGFASMFALPSYNSLPDWSEGIAQRIDKLVPGNKYLFSFFDKFRNFNANGAIMDAFNVVLMHCNPDAGLFDNNTFYIPTLTPGTFQTIVCQAAISNTEWQRYITSFIATQDFDMILIYPRDVTALPFVGLPTIQFAYPELIDISPNKFTAGPPPVPVPPGCMVTIGPNPPNCGVANAVFTWQGPLPWQTIVVPQWNQQITLDASDPQNVGQWTLTMTVPNAALPNGGCSGLALPTISASVTVPLCNAIWPKIYAAKTAEYLGKDNNGNLFMYLHEADLTVPMLNHIGWLPSNPTTNDEYTFHYTISGGSTTWGKTNLKPSIALNSGDIQLFNANTSFYNATTGSPSTSPGLVPPNEIILAETNAGEFITKDQNSIIYAHSSSFGLPAVLNLGTGVSKTIFKQNLNQLFILSGGFPGPRFDVYSYNAGTNQWNAVSNTILPPDPPGGGNPTTFLQVDNQGKVYMLKNFMLQEYNYLSIPATFTPVVINGFDNQNLLAVTQYNKYTEDKCMVIHQTESALYAIDLSAMTKKKVTVTNLSNSNSYRCAFDGNNVFVSAFIIGNGVTIGNQNIPALGPDFHSTFLTKFNLLTDFNFGSGRSYETNISQNKISFDAALSPNPVYNALKIGITENGKQSRSAYTISIVNHMGIPLLRKEKYISDGYLNISSLRTGVYYVEIMNDKGQKISKPMRKL